LGLNPYEGIKWFFFSCETKSCYHLLEI
jgi:hypothetical protein